MTVDSVTQFHTKLTNHALNTEEFLLHMHICVIANLRECFDYSRMSGSHIQETRDCGKLQIFSLLLCSVMIKSGNIINLLSRNPENLIKSSNTKEKPKS